MAAVRRQQVGMHALAWMPPPAASGSFDLSSTAPTRVRAQARWRSLWPMYSRARGDVTLIDLARGRLIGASEAIEVRADLGMRGWTGGRRGAARIVRLIESPSGT